MRARTFFCRVNDNDWFLTIHKVGSWEKSMTHQKIIVNCCTYLSPTESMILLYFFETSTQFKSSLSFDAVLGVSKEFNGKIYYIYGVCPITLHKNDYLYSHRQIPLRIMTFVQRRTTLHEL